MIAGKTCRLITGGQGNHPFDSTRVHRLPPLSLLAACKVNNNRLLPSIDGTVE